MTDAEGRTAVRRKELRPAEIVRAALDVFTQEGFGGARISEIARRAGAAKGTVYLYFETKEALFEAVVLEYMKPGFAAVEQLVQAFDGPTDELLARMIERMYAEIAGIPHRRGIVRILIGEGERFPHLTEFYHREVISGAKKLLRTVIQRGVERGEFRACAVIDFPATLIGPIMLASVWKMVFDTYEPLDIPQFARAHVDLILNGLRATPVEQTRVVR